MQKGKFITFEGIEGVGKSTNILYLKEYLESKGINVIVTREPGGTPLAEKIRDILLSKSSENISGLSELLLFFAARLQHVNNLILPNLEQGTWVLCDRFYDSTYAYQCAGRGINKEEFNQLKNLTLKDFKPDLTILLDAPVKLGLGRAAKRSEADRFESEKVDFFEKIRLGFHELVKLEPNRIKVVDASCNINEVQTSLIEVIESSLL